MNKVSINGKNYEAPDGCSISVINDKVYFNGKLQEDLNNFKTKNITINVEGNCNEVKADAGNINIEGNVEGNVSADAGNIKIKGDVKGNVQADCGNISANNIMGKAYTECGIIKKTSGRSNFFNNIIDKYIN